MKSKSEVKSIIKSKFLCQDKFSNDIEQLVKDNAGMNYIEAICFYCEDNNIEIESITKLISKPLKEKLKCNATNLNYLKRTSKARLVL
jgi:hypothetical protein